MDWISLKQKFLVDVQNRQLKDPSIRINSFTVIENILTEHFPEYIGDPNKILLVNKRDFLNQICSYKRSKKASGADKAVLNALISILDPLEFDSASKLHQSKYSVKQILIVVTIVVLALWIIGKFMGANPQEMKSEPFIISQNFMEDYLKAPATAKFPTADYETTYLGENNFKVKSYVDAQNGFGALMRTHYEVELHWNGKEWSDQRNWNLISINTNP